MISTEDKKAVIYNAINSAICIDDQYESPYCDIPEMHIPEHTRSHSGSL